MTIKLQVINNYRFPLRYATDGAAGLDLHYQHCESVYGEYIMGYTGLHVAIPQGHVGLLIPRSSLHTKGWQLANTIGVIDSDYRGEILIKLVPTKQDYWPDLPQYGDRIAQLVIVPCPTVEVEEVTELPTTDRGDGGFGSTGR